MKHKIENSGHGHCIAMLPDGACHRPIHSVSGWVRQKNGGWNVSTEIQYWRHNPRKKK